MNKIGYTLAILSALIVSVFFLLKPGSQSPFPPIDRSTEYEYCVTNEGIYLKMVRHDVYLFITQYGLMHSKDPKLVKRDQGHDKVYEILHREFANTQEFDEELAQYNAWEDQYNENPVNKIDLNNAEFRVRIPRNQNPYEWKPDENMQSFREHYNEADENTFRKSIFYDTKLYL